RQGRMSLRWQPDADGTLSLSAFLGMLVPLRVALFYTARDPDVPSADLKVRVKIIDLKHVQSGYSVVLATSLHNGHESPFPVAKELVSTLGRFRSVPVDAGPPIRDMDALHAYQ